MPERATWASKAGFVLASAGAAVGLGAIWKFPWLAGSNGGAVFVIPYVILSLTLGFVFLTAEITLGYMGRGSIVTTMRKLGGSKWVPAGYLGVVTGLLVLSFYSVIGGWTIAYLVGGSSRARRSSVPGSARFQETRFSRLAIRRSSLRSPRGLSRSK